jgi:hypothetical protein
METARFFQQDFQENGSMERWVVFVLIVLTDQCDAVPQSCQ